MSLNYAAIELSPDDFFRILRWSRDVNFVEIFDFNANRFVPHRGIGSQWHRHPELEITLITSGDGIRFHESIELQPKFSGATKNFSIAISQSV